MNQKYILYETPGKFFTNDFRYFLRAIPMTITTAMPPLLENECVLAYIVSGMGCIYINGILFRIKPGSLCQFHSYHVFQIEPEGTRPLEIIFLVEDYTLMSYWGFSAPDPSSEVQNTFYLPPVIEPCAEDQKSIRQLFAAIQKEDSHPKKHSLLIKSAIGARIMCLYQHICLANVKNHTRYTPSAVWNAMIYITAYGYLNLTLEDVSAQFQITPVLLNRELKRITYMNFSQFLARSRINYASAALMLEQISLHSIAVNSGFASESTFFRQFYKHRGCTPKEYREKIAAEKFQQPNTFISDKAYEILFYIIRHFNEETSLKTLCNDLYMTEQSVTTILDRCFHTTYHHLLTVYRLRYAQALLLVSPMKLEDIAAYCGFHSSHTFIRRFKEEKQITPTEYRNKYKENLHETERTGTTGRTWSEP